MRAVCSEIFMIYRTVIAVLAVIAFAVFNAEPAAMFLSLKCL